MVPWFDFGRQRLKTGLVSFFIIKNEPLWKLSSICLRNHICMKSFPCFYRVSLHLFYYQHTLQWHTYGGHRATLWGWFSSPTMWLLGIKLRSLCFQQVISTALLYTFKYALWCINSCQHRGVFTATKQINLLISCFLKPLEKLPPSKTSFHLYSVMVYFTHTQINIP